MEYRIRVTLAKLAKSRGINTQKELLAVVEEKTGKKLRPATVSDMYNDKGRSINRDYLEVIAAALEIQNVNDLIELYRYQPQYNEKQDAE